MRQSVFSCVKKRQLYPLLNYADIKFHQNPQLLLRYSSLSRIRSGATHFVYPFAASVYFASLYKKLRLLHEYSRVPWFTAHVFSKFIFVSCDNRLMTAFYWTLTVELIHTCSEHHTTVIQCLTFHIDVHLSPLNAHTSFTSISPLASSMKQSDAPPRVSSPAVSSLNGFNPTKS